MRKNIPLHKSLKFKINLLVTTLFLVIIGFLMYKSDQNQQEMIRTKEDDLDQIAVDTIDRRFTVSYQILETSLAQITASPLIVETMAAGDADELSKLVLQSYEQLKEVGVEEFHFYFPDDRSLLNLYEPKKGEVITPCERSIVKDINADPEHLPIKGIEECRHGVFLRYIAPVYNNKEYIGSVELGMEVESRILNIFKNVSGGEWYLYSFNEREQPLLESTIIEDTHPLEITKELVASLGKGEVFKTEESGNIIQMIPIPNYKGEYQHYFKRVFDNSELIALQNEYTKHYILYGILAAVFSVFLLWTALTYLLNPLSYLEQKVRRLESGTLIEPIEVHSNDEIGYLAGAMENMRQSLNKREDELKEQSFIDPLTGVRNRLSFEQKLNEIVEKELSPTTLIMADIDGLKQINDNQGHAAGDAHIIRCTEIIQKALRDNDQLFRIGGDEFMVVFPGTNQQIGEAILSRIKKEFEKYNHTLNKEDRVLSVSFGIGVCEGDPCTLEQAMALADKEMYKNKAEKKKQTT